MRIERTFGEEFRYSLHDAQVQKFEYKKGDLILHFDYIFSYNDDGTENYHKAKVVFEDTDIDEISFLVFEDKLTKTFNGRYIDDLSEYKRSYRKSRFEIIKKHTIGEKLFFKVCYDIRKSQYIVL